MTKKITKKDFADLFDDMFVKRIHEDVTIEHLAEALRPLLFPAQPVPTPAPAVEPVSAPSLTKLRNRLLDRGYTVDVREYGWMVSHPDRPRFPKLSRPGTDERHLRRLQNAVIWADDNILLHHVTQPAPEPVAGPMTEPEPTPEPYRNQVITIDKLEVLTKKQHAGFIGVIVDMARRGYGISEIHRELCKTTRPDLSKKYIERAKRRGLIRNAPKPVLRPMPNPLKSELLSGTAICDPRLRK